ncbi:MAG: hypothetical protein IIC89_08025 [Chloroflexi bacterium]|nr:hypothetical protein [Chloroflexota bacterium]
MLTKTLAVRSVALGVLLVALFGLHAEASSLVRQPGGAGVTCYTLTTNVGAGSGSVLTSPTSWGACPEGQYAAGYQPALSAEPAPGFVWAPWSGTDNNGVNPTLVTMNADRKVTANFESNCYTLTTNVGAGSGSVLTSPKSAGGCPNGQYPYGYTAAVSAEPAPGFVWAPWSGTDNDVANPTLVTMNADRKVTANFASNCYTLTANAGAGSGSVTANAGAGRATGSITSASTNTPSTRMRALRNS